MALKCTTLHFAYLTPLPHYTMHTSHSTLHTAHFTHYTLFSVTARPHTSLTPIMWGEYWAPISPRLLLCLSLSCDKDLFEDEFLIAQVSRLAVLNTVSVFILEINMSVISPLARKDRHFFIESFLEVVSWCQGLYDGATLHYPIHRHGKP